MRTLLLLFLLVVSQTAFGQKHELGLTLGGLFPQDRGMIPNTVRLGRGTALQANYGRRITGRPVAALYGEAHFLANPLRTAGSGNPASTRDVASLYVTPGIRVKFAPNKSLSPYAAVGGGLAWYEQSVLRIDGKPNPAPRNTYRGAFDFGGGVDTKFRRWIGLRAEIRDFYTGSPAYNIPNLGGGQHNVVVGGGFVVKWGE
jgi:opacity protein-like surface antigen